jgi:cytochrome c oxidase subunit IV
LTSEVFGVTIYLPKRGATLVKLLFISWVLIYFGIYVLPSLSMVLGFMLLALAGLIVAGFCMLRN